MIPVGDGLGRHKKVSAAESNMETYITICKIDSPWLAGDIKQGYCDNLEGWDGEGDGREVQERGDRVYLWLILIDV